MDNCINFHFKSVVYVHFCLIHTEQRCMHFHLADGYANSLKINPYVYIFLLMYNGYLDKSLGYSCAPVICNLHLNLLATFSDPHAIHGVTQLLSCTQYPFTGSTSACTFSLSQPNLQKIKMACRKSCRKSRWRVHSKILLHMYVFRRGCSIRGEPGTSGSNENPITILSSQ